MPSKLKNVYKVPTKQWKKWNSQEQELFNTLYGFSKKKPWVFSHPESPELSKEQWKTVAWNHAWMATDLVMEQRKRDAN